VRKIILYAITAVLTVTATSSQACRVLRDPAQVLTSGYDKRTISAVALVKVANARYIQPPSGDAHPWQATATVTKVFRGSYKEKTADFVRGWGSAACDGNPPLPKAGERWVIYFWKMPDGKLAVWRSYPASDAKTYDPKLRGLIL
jgi:hypothetical protein